MKQGHIAYKNPQDRLSAAASAFCPPFFSTRADQNHAHCGSHYTIILCGRISAACKSGTIRGRRAGRRVKALEEGTGNSSKLSSCYTFGRLYCTRQKLCSCYILRLRLRPGALHARAHLMPHVTILKWPFLGRSKAPA